MALRAPMPIERHVVIQPRPSVAWEANGVANPGVTRLPDGTIQMIYRAADLSGRRYLGVCRLTDDGDSVIPGTRSDYPVNRRDSREIRDFPDGCSDPRINFVNDQYYVWAYGRNNDRLRENRARYGNDFRHQYIGGRQIVGYRTTNFADFEYFGLCGPDEFCKNAFLHSECIKVDGDDLFAFFHRIKNNVQVLLLNRLDDLKSRDIWVEHVSRMENFTLLRPEFAWEGIEPERGWPGSVAGAAPPLRIEERFIPPMLDRQRRYWLLFYNAAGQPRENNIARDRHVGVVLLALKKPPSLCGQPFEVIARAPEPILSPETGYERNGPNGDVVFATGAVITTDGQNVDLFFGSGDVAVSKVRFAVRELVSYVSQFDIVGCRRTIDSELTQLCAQMCLDRTPAHISAP